MANGLRVRNYVCRILITSATPWRANFMGLLFRTIVIRLGEETQSLTAQAVSRCESQRSAS